MIKCPICETEFEGESLVDDCPYCDWTYLGYEDEMDIDEKDSANPVTIRQARKLFSEGKNIWGDPLPEKK